MQITYTLIESGILGNFESYRKLLKYAGTNYIKVYRDNGWEVYRLNTKE